MKLGFTLYAVLQSTLSVFAQISVAPRQPTVITLESHPSRRSAGIISLPEGSLWCQGQPTIWIPGHPNELVDSPNCLIDGEWTQPHIADMQLVDTLNARDDPFVTDRHGCGAIDANNDGRLDVYCAVGANLGRGVGYNELYLTRNDGTLRKVRRNGLQWHIGQRTRQTTILKGANDTELVFISASFGPREDNKINKHSMYLKNGKHNGSRHWRRYFEHVQGPWQKHTNASCAIAADVNSDGLDDLIVCNEKIGAFIFEQRQDGSFKPSIPTLHNSMNNWRNARTADFNGDGLLDLAVIYHSEEESFLRVFDGIPDFPFFNFGRNSYYGRPLPFAAPDLEVIDANGDGIMDLYVVQADEGRRGPNGTMRTDNYCGGRFVDEMWYTGGPSRIMPPANYTPPNDIAPDLLLIGNPGAPFHQRFQEFRMEHSEPGCGYFVKKFGERSLVLVQGGFVRPGHQLLLEF